MSQLIGQYGSRNPQTYTQPRLSSVANAPTPLALAYGNFLGKGIPSLGADDPTRQRPESYVLPRQIELMHGFFTENFAPQGFNTFATNSVNQQVMAAIRPSKSVNQQLATAVAKKGANSPNLDVNTGVYGLTYSTITQKQCAANPNCRFNNSGGCDCNGITTQYFTQ